MGEILDIGDEQDDDDQTNEVADLLMEAQRILFRLAMQEDPAELRQIATRFLADSMSPAAVRAVLGMERHSKDTGGVSAAA